jgi:mRNA interferase MazF
MKRGDLVTVALQGDYGQPRPALVIQSDLFDEHPSVTVLPVTGALRDAPLFRLPLPAGPGTGLRDDSQIMVDKPQTVPREKIGPTIGRIDDATQLAVNRALAVFLGFT